MIDPAQFIQIVRRSMDVVAHRTMRDWSRFVRTTGISMAQFSVLMQLHYKGACGVSDISERMDITSAAASQLVEKLVQSGLIERAEDPQDRRLKRITLSPKGQDLIRAGIMERYRWVEALSESLSDTEREKIGQALIILSETLQRLEPQESPQ